MGNIRHSFSSPRSNDPNQSAMVLPGDWNEYHVSESQTYLASHLAPEAIGMEFLAAATSGTAQSAITVNFAPREELMVFIHASGMTVAEHVSMRFNGDVGLNYWDRILRANAPLAGISTVAQTQGASRTGVRIHADALAGSRFAMFNILNRADRTKIMSLIPQAGSGAATAVSRTGIGLGEWANATEQITSITAEPDGTATFTGKIIVLGRNAP